MRTLALASFVASLTLGCGAASEAAAAPPPPRGPVRIVVDATRAPQKILRAHLSMPVSPGPLTLLYPKWIPGEHAPSGPIVNLAGLRLAAAGKPVAWHRDDADMYAIQVDVPAGADTLEIDLEYLGAPDGRFSSGLSSTLELLDLSWNHVVLYPKGPSPAQLTYVARVELPPGWKYSTALPVAGEQGAAVELKPASLTTLIDSPLVAGAHRRAIPLGDVGGAPHELDVIADSEEALAIPAQRVAAYEHLVVEANALFGARHYDAYHFLYTLSDQIAGMGLEHHASSDNRSGERALLDEDARRMDAWLLPHEFVHSWNGKHRRPKGLVTRDYQEPMRTDLLWIYEGLTEYLGWVLTGRSGLASDEEEREALAWDAAELEGRPGRLWRPLADTAVAAQTLYTAPRAFRSARRGVDFYDEGTLLWLEVDVAIRTQTQGQRLLDDFCRAFFGGKDTGAEVTPYALDDVLRALSAVAPRDWRAFFEARVDRIAEHPPLEGVTAGGYDSSAPRSPTSSSRAGRAPTRCAI